MTRIFSSNTVTHANLFAIALIMLVSRADAQNKQQAKPKVFHAASPADIFQRIRPSIFVVESLDSKERIIALGSGVSVEISSERSNEGNLNGIVTNCHVVDDAATIVVRQSDKLWAAKIAYADTTRDVCLLASSARTPSVAMRLSKTLKVGERVYAVGNPKGLEVSFSEGMVSGLREVGGASLVQTTAPISSGSSGGGLFDERGHLVGITSFQMREGQNLNFALPTEWILEVHLHPATQGVVTTTPYGAKSSAFFRAIDQFFPNIQAAFWSRLAYEEHIDANYEKAIYAAKSVLEIRPEDAAAWVQLGASLNALGKCDEAGKALQEGLRINPKFALGWYNLGFAYVCIGSNSQAVAAYEESVRLDAKDLDAWYGLGYASSLQGNREKTLSVYEKLSDMDAEKAKRFFQNVVLPQRAAKKEPPQS